MDGVCYTVATRHNISLSEFKLKSENKEHGQYFEVAFTQAVSVTLT